MKKLFEIGVLGCAKGDFSGGSILFCEPQTTTVPRQSSDTTCECKGLTIPGNVKFFNSFDDIG